MSLAVRFDLTGPVTAWVDVCGLDALTPERGACAWVAGRQVALFRLAGGREVLALSNHDPFSGAPVLSRGIVGSRRGEPVVWSPMYKQAFELRTGLCADDPTVAVPVFPVRVEAGRVLVGAP